MNSQIVFLSDLFYRDHPNPPFKEMEQKQNRWRAQTWCKSVPRSVAASPDVTPS